MTDREPHRVIAIAHRGASAYAPENTFAAFDLAVLMRISEIELDVQFTSDSHIIVIHDETLGRTTDSTGALSERTLEEIQLLDAGSWFDEVYSGEKVPTLGEVFDRYKDELRYHIEIKSKDAEGLASRTCDLIREYGLENRTTITSFWKQWLIESRSYAPEIKTGWLVPLGYEAEWDDRVIEEAIQEGFTQICPRASLASPYLVRSLHDAGFNVRCWGVFNEELMIQVVESGADSMTLNFPDKLIKPRRSPKEIEDGLDYSFPELCLPLIIWCLSLITVLVLVFADHSWVDYYFYFLVGYSLLGIYVRISDTRFREKRFRLNHWEK